MRKNLYLGLIACAALTMTGCSNDEVSYSSSKQEVRAIQFDTYLGKNVQGRGTETTTNSIQTTDKFGVTAFYTGQTVWTSPTKAPDFMYNEKVSYSDSKWTYSPVKYWPTMKNDRISFFAYAPYSASDGNNGITLPGKSNASTPTSLTFEINATASGMIDFVAAQVINATQQDGVSEENTNSDREAVSFTFKHELSRLAFKVKTSKDLETGSHVVLKSAELVAGGYYKKATYTFANTSAGVGTWTFADENKTSEKYDLSSIINFDAEKTIGGKPYGASENVFAFESSTTPEELFTTGQYLFLIPPAGNTGLSANTAAVKFTYDIVTQDGELAAGFSCTSADKTVYLPAGILKQGEAYNVTFTFDVDDIEVSGSVATWTNGTDPSDTEIPFTPNNAVAGN